MDILSAVISSCVIQLNEYEKNQYKVSVNEQGQILIGNELPKNVDYLFVLLDNEMFASPKNFSHNTHQLICHTSFTDYAPVDAAGLLKFNDDHNLVTIEAYSGHYEPSLMRMHSAYDYLQSLGIDMQQVQISNFQDRL